MRKFCRFGYLLTIVIALTACQNTQTSAPATAPPAADAAPPLILTASIPLEGVKGRFDHFASGKGKVFVSGLGNNSVEVIDLYQIHWPDPEPEMEEGWQTLGQLQEEGKVRYIGVSNFNVTQMKRVERIAPITSLQPNYNMVTRDIEKEVLPFCREQHIGVIVYSPMKSGLLTGKMNRERIASLPPDDFRPRTASFKEPLLSRNLGVVEVLRGIGERHSRTPGEVAIAWTLRDPVVTGAIVGMRSAEQAKQIVRSAEFRLSPDEILAIEEYLQANPVAA